MVAITNQIALFQSLYLILYSPSLNLSFERNIQPIQTQESVAINEASHHSRFIRHFPKNNFHSAPTRGNHFVPPLEETNLRGGRASATETATGVAT